MNLEVGQYITVGENDLLVCAISEYEGKRYVYLLNEEEDASYFYEMQKKGDLWKFTRETNVGQIKQLIIHFSGIKQKLVGDINGK